MRSSRHSARPLDRANEFHPGLLTYSRLTKCFRKGPKIEIIPLYKSLARVTKGWLIGLFQNLEVWWVEAVYHL